MTVRRRRVVRPGDKFVRLAIILKEDTLQRVKAIAEKEERSTAHMIDILLQRAMIE